MVRWTCRRPGNRWSKWRRKWACRPRVRVEAEELADDLDRQHLAVREDRRRAALAQPTFAAQVAEEVVHEAEHDDDEGLQVHGCGPRGCLAADQPLSCPGELRDLCRSRKPARRVS